MRFQTTGLPSRIVDWDATITRNMTTLDGQGRSRSLGILRSTDRFRLSSDNLGHSVQATVTIGRERGVRFGGRIFDVSAEGKIILDAKLEVDE